MRSVLLITLALFASISLNSSAEDFKYNFDRNADFSSFKTYKWIELAGTGSVDELTDKRIRASVDAQLARKGLRSTASDDADLYVGYQTTVRQEVPLTIYKDDWGYGPGWGLGWYTARGAATDNQSSTISKGQLAVDVYDSRSHALVWRGITKEIIGTNAKPERVAHVIEKAFARLFKKYPPLRARQRKSGGCIDGAEVTQQAQPICA